MTRTWLKFLPTFHHKRPTRSKQPQKVDLDINNHILSNRAKIWFSGSIKNSQDKSPVKWLKDIWSQQDRLKFKCCQGAVVHKRRISSKKSISCNKKKHRNILGQRVLKECQYAVIIDHHYAKNLQTSLTSSSQGGKYSDVGKELN